MANLALSAATFDSEEPKSQSILQKRKNRTYKNANNMSVNDKTYYSDKVNNVLNKIHSQIYSDNDDNDDVSYGNFEPITNPISMKTGKNEVEEFSTMTTNPQNVVSQINNVPNYNITEYTKSSHFANDGQQNPSNAPSHYHYPHQIQQNNVKLDTFPVVNDIHNYSQPYNQDNKLLMEKLNYMIHLLEETHDEQTNNVMEEVILYSFLGIFIIFLIDNFIKVGRYVR
jgi:hypothetical protein